MNTNNATTAPATVTEFTPRHRLTKDCMALSIASDVMELYHATLATLPEGRDHLDILVASFRAAGWGPCEADGIPVDLVFSICAALAQL